MQDQHSGAEPPSEARRGLGYGLAAYLLWGLFPIYLHALGNVAPGEVLAHRIVWSLLLVVAMILLAGRLAQVSVAIRDARVMLTLLATALLIAVNWLVYIHAVSTGRLLAGSLGYYLNPLVSIALGVVVLKERLSRGQGGAIILALAGVVVLAANAGGALWISCTLAVTFSAYGLLRKMAPVDPLTGLAIETAMLAPLSAGYIIWREASGVSSFGDSATTATLLLLSGVVTALPLLLFSAAAKRLRYSTIGILQFVAPTLQFLLAVFAFGEVLTRAHVVCFAAIWAAVAIYVADGLRLGRAQASRTVAAREA